MNTVNVATLKTSLSYYLHSVERGKDFVVTSHKQPIAKIIPFKNLTIKKPQKSPAALRNIKGVKLQSQCDPVSILLEDRKMR